MRERGRGAGEPSREPESEPVKPACEPVDAPALAARLQGLVGNRVTAQLLGTGTRVLARMPSASDLLERVAPQFDAQLSGPRGQMAQGHSLKEHVARILASYERDIAASHGNPQRYAMVVAAIGSGVARSLAAKYNDPTLIPAIAREVVRAYQEDLPGWLLAGDTEGQEGADARRGVAIAAEIAGSDVIERLLKARVPQAKAVLEIRTMALKAGVKPSEACDMLIQQHRLDMGAFSGSEVAQGFRARDPGRGFDLTNLVGSIPPAYHHAVTTRVSPQGDAPGTNLAALRRAVAEWDDANEELRATPRTPRDPASTTADSEPDEAGGARPAAPGAEELQAAKEGLRRGEGARPPGRDGDAASLSERQYAHIRAIEREEGRNDRPEDRLDRIARFIGKLHPDKDDDELHDLAREVVAGMNDMTLTIRVSGRRMFGTQSAPTEPGEYQSSQQLSQRTETMSDIIPGAAPGRGLRYHDAGGHNTRGENYPRWRHDKDQRQTRFSGFDTGEWAKFAAVHASFKSTKGRGERTTFGDTMLVLNDDVKNRATFSFSTEAPERRSMAELFCDVLDANKAGDRTAMPILRTILANTIEGEGGEAADFISFQLEAHIYGKLDVATDTKEILVDPSVPEDTYTAIVDFAAGKFDVGRNT